MSPSARLVFIVLIAAIQCACSLFGPSESVTGQCEGRTNGSPAGLVYLNLNQNGDIVTGTACWVGQFRAAPVGSSYPNVKYTVTETSGCNQGCCEGLILGYI